MNEISNDSVLVIKRSELINLLVDSYIQGIETVQEMIAVAAIKRDDLIKMFDAKFSGTGAETKN